MRHIILLFLLLLNLGCENKISDAKKDSLSEIKLNTNQDIKNNSENRIGIVNFVSFEIQTIVGIHKHQIDNNNYGNTICKISEFDFKKLLNKNNAVIFSQYDVRIKIEFDNEVYWIGNDYSSSTDDFLAVSLDGADDLWSIDTKKLLDILDDCY